MSTRRREPSLRAHARALYREAAANACATQATEPAATQEQPLTAVTERARALYEESIVPVREIARLAGVTERTLYKYARKLGWRPRVTRLMHDPKGLRTARGAGGRFVPLTEEGAYPRGIGALDPAGASQAAERCDKAGLLSDAAVAEAARAARERAAHIAREEEAEARLRNLETLCRALAEAGCLLHEAPPKRQKLAGKLLDLISREIGRPMPG
jgi:hypothetical protein